MREKNKNKPANIDKYKYSNLGFGRGDKIKIFTNHFQKQNTYQ